MSLELVFGPMCSGKSTFLTIELEKYSQLKRKVVYITHTLDSRDYNTHSKLQFGTFYRKKTDYLETVDKTFQVIGIDEAQFFDENNLITFVKECVSNGCIVIVCGLDGDYKMNKFGGIISLIPFADKVKKLTSFCQPCFDKGNIIQAPFTKKIVHCTDSDNQIDVGGIEKYIPVCRKCFY